MNLFGTLNTATTGLGVNEMALQTTSHNIANANNPYYSRQRVDIETLPAMHFAGVGDIGMGARAGSVQRISDSFVQGQLNQVGGVLNSYSERANVLGQLEGYYNEPSSTGILSQIDKMNAAWTNFANDPSVSGIQTTVVGATQTVANSINQLANNVQALQSNTVSTVAKNAMDFNQTINQLDTLNKQIYNMSQNGDQPNDLLDTRDQIIQKLSSMADTTTTIDQYGRATVALNMPGTDGKATPTPILDADGVKGTLGVVDAKAVGVITATTDVNSENSTLAVPSNGKAGDLVFVANNTTTATPVMISSGTMQGDQQALSDLNDQMGKLNKFAYQLATATNTLMSANGVSADKLMFTFKGVTGQANPQPAYDPKVNYAANLQVNATIANSPSQLQAGVGTNPDAGDGKLAQAIANLQNTKLADPASGKGLTLSTDNLSFVADATGATVSGMYNDIVTQNGIVTQAANNNAQTQLALLQQVQAKQQSISGVNMNEEMSNVIKFQQGFQANAKMISVVNEMLDTLINRTGVN